TRGCGISVAHLRVGSKPQLPYSYIPMRRQNIRSVFLWIVTILGAVLALYCALSLPVARLDLTFAALSLIAILLGSRITIRVPLAKARISISDTFVFLILLLYGTEAAVLVATCEAFASSMLFSQRKLVRLFNAAVMGISTFVTAIVLELVLGSGAL